MSVFDACHISALDVPTGSLWVHRKGGTYRVLRIGLMEADLTQAVMYESLSGDAGVWIRPLEEFLDGRFTRKVE